MPLAYAGSISMQTVTGYSQKRWKVFIHIKGNRDYLESWSNLRKKVLTLESRS